MMKPALILCCGMVFVCLALALTVAVFWLRFVWRKKNAGRGEVPPSPLTVSDVLLCGALLALGLAFKLPPIGALTAAFVVLLLAHQQRGVPAIAYWRFRWRDVFSYLKSGAWFCLGILPPMMAIVFCVGLACLYLGVEFTQPVVGQMLRLETWRQTAAFLAVAVIIAPLWEEMLFRGVLYPFLKKHMPLGWAMLLSSSAWAVIHWHWPVLLPFTFLGCALCLLYEQSGKLGNTIAAHAVFNLANAALLLVAKYDA